MRILVHDYPGHPFPPQLSRDLARRGHQVMHVFFAEFQAPHGALSRRPDDAPGLTIHPIHFGRPFEKYNFARRVFQEIAYGRRLVEVIRDYKPDVALAGNAPLDIQALSFRYCRRAGIPFVYWHQDIYSIAIDRILRRKLSVVGALIGARYIALEKRLLRDSDHVVTITADFLPIFDSWGVDRARVSVIENWAPLNELPTRPRDNAWARAHGLVGPLVFLYAGTLGLKHDPALLLRLARACADRGDARVVVVSEGLGADWLKQHGRGVDALTVLPFQPYERVPEVLAAGDVLVAVLDPDAGIFSVPSKVLAYFCAGRPVLGAIPPENLAARLIVGHGAGVAVPPGDPDGFVAAALRLADDADKRAALAKNALDYAAKTFDIAAIGARFLTILSRLTKA